MRRALAAALSASCLVLAAEARAEEPKPASPAAPPAKPEEEDKTKARDGFSASAPAHGVDATKQASGDPAPVLMELHGYVQPAFGTRYRPQALPRDRWEYGGLSSRAGLIVSGTPVKDFGYVIHLSLDARSLQVLTDVNLVRNDVIGDLGLSRTYTPATGTLFEEVSVSYKPVRWISARLGAMRMPFTVALRSSNTALMFIGRPGPNEAFQSGSDLGGLVLVEPLDGKIRGSLGAFTGVSLQTPSAQFSSSNNVRGGTAARGIVWSARLDANPLGPLPQAEVDFEHGPVRFGAGVGGLLRTGTAFAGNGYELTQFRDLRASASLRFSALGFFVQAEVLRRLVTDNLGSRPDQATGAYGAASYYVPITKSVGVAPIARVGVTVQDEATLPRRTTFLEGGLSLFPRADQPKPESVRVLVQYSGERSTTDDESAHAVVGQVQVLF